MDNRKDQIGRRNLRKHGPAQNRRNHKKRFEAIITIRLETGDLCSVRRMIGELRASITEQSVRKLETFWSHATQCVPFQAERMAADSGKHRGIKGCRRSRIAG
jgi:hypothetical protein